MRMTANPTICPMITLDIMSRYPHQSINIPASNPPHIFIFEMRNSMLTLEGSNLWGSHTRGFRNAYGGNLVLVVDYKRNSQDAGRHEPHFFGAVEVLSFSSTNEAFIIMPTSRDAIRKRLRYPMAKNLDILVRFRFILNHAPQKMMAFATP